ncbi:hypothetical protein M422DRAFT_189647 [Sphaerobolus stellatus SS14]|uniref:Core-binding (CB) domain-containing protein n=1 Tax=Sphaerobolus stellatus (strain SS14) TaxID=990650 RepID=A0A0C9UT60_SPHS4|nr:hypothetical protein M422DRAFT_189647 [Sphaerobolus stellatus SS14]
MPPKATDFTPIYNQLRQALTSSPPRPTLPPPPISTSIPCSLSPETKLKLQDALDNSLAPSTTCSYRHAVRRFIAFCDKEKIPSHLRWPADEFVLCAFAASHTGRLTGGTVKGYLAGIRAWHIAHNAPYQGSIRLAYIVNGVSNLAPSSSKRSPRPPITRRMLRLLFDHLDLSSPFDVAVFATAITAFWGQCRLGELLPDTHHVSKPFSGPLRKHLEIGISSASLFLPWTKTTKTQGATITLTRQMRPLDPIAIMQLHFATSPASATSPLFSFCSKDRSILLSRTAFINRCNAIWIANGLPRITGHSFRIGGVPRNCW